MATRASYSSIFVSNIKNAGQELTKTAEESVKTDKSHNLIQDILNNRQALKDVKTKKERYVFGDNGLRTQAEIVQNAIRNFEQAYEEVQYADRRTAVFAAACLSASFFSPILPTKRRTKKP